MATAKRIQVSSDNGVTYWTLPGSQGDKTVERNKAKDTVYGQSYESEFNSLGSVSMNSNAIYKGIAGYLATVKKVGTSTAMTAEACSLVSGKTYKITSAAKQLIDINTAVNVFDNAVNQNANVLSIDYLYGRVTFKPAYTVTGPITITGNYFPLANIAKAKSFNLNQTCGEVDNTGYEDAQANSGFKVLDYGIRTVNLEVGRIIANAAASLNTDLVANSIYVIELAPGGDNTKLAYRGYFQLSSVGGSGNNGEVEAESLKFGLYVPDAALLETPSKWLIGSSSGVNQAIQIVLNAFQNQTTVKVRYLEDGATGTEITAIVTDASITNTIEGINEYKFAFKGASGLTTV